MNQKKFTVNCNWIHSWRIKSLVRKVIFLEILITTDVLLVFFSFLFFFFNNFFQFYLLLIVNEHKKNFVHINRFSEIKQKNSLFRTTAKNSRGFEEKKKLLFYLYKLWEIIYNLFLLFLLHNTLISMILFTHYNYDHDNFHLNNSRILTQKKNWIKRNAKKQKKQKNEKQTNILKEVNK